MAFQSTSITGSLFGTASWVISASWGPVTGSPWTGSAIATGSYYLNNAPVVGTSFMMAGFTANTPYNTNGPVTFSKYKVITGSNNDISFDGTFFTLKPGSYEIEMVLGTNGWASTAFVSTTWAVSASSGQNLNLWGFPQYNQLTSAPGVLGGYINRMVTYCQPTASITVGCIYRTVNTTVSANASNTFLKIQKII